MKWEKSVMRFLCWGVKLIGRGERCGDLKCWGLLGRDGVCIACGYDW